MNIRESLNKYSTNRVQMITPITDMSDNHIVRRVSPPREFIGKDNICGVAPYKNDTVITCSYNNENGTCWGTLSKTTLTDSGELTEVVIHTENAGIYNIARMGNYYYACTTDSTVICLDLTLEEHPILTKFKSIDPSSTGTSIKTNEQNNLIALTMFNGQLIVYDVTGSIKTQFKCSSRETFCCEFYNSSTVLSGSEECCVNIWDIRIPKKVACVGSGYIKEAVVSLFNYDENYIAVGTYEDCCHVYDMRSPFTPLKRIQLQGAPWSYFPMENYYVVPSIRGGVHVFDSEFSNAQTILPADDNKFIYGSAYLTKNHKKYILSYDFNKRLVLQNEVTF